MAIQAPNMAATIPIAAPNSPTTTPKSAASTAIQIGKVITRSTTTSRVEVPEEDRAIRFLFCWVCSNNRSAFIQTLNLFYFGHFLPRANINLLQTV
jgi:hypothetical protein